MPFDGPDNYQRYKTFSPNGRVPCLQDGEGGRLGFFGHYRIFGRDQAAGLANLKSCKNLCAVSQQRNACWVSRFARGNAP